MAAEYVVKEGNAQVILCERGIKTFERATRYTLDLSAIPVLKHETHLPVIVDPSHAAGKRDLVLPLARAAVAAGADGIIVEVIRGRRRRSATGRSRSRRRSSPTSRTRSARSRHCSARRSADRAAGDRRHRPDRRVRRARRPQGRRRGVAGWDPDEAHLAAAAERGAIEPAPLGAALAGAELAVVAAPVAALPAQVRAVLDAAPNRLHRHGRRLDEGRRLRRGGRRGPLHRRPSDLRLRGARAGAGDGRAVRGATWFLTPIASTEPERESSCHGFVASLGAIPVAVDPDAHDRLVAITSHLPHALANVLLNQAGGAVEGHEPLAPPAARCAT